MANSWTREDLQAFRDVAPKMVSSFLNRLCALPNGAGTLEDLGVPRSAPGVTTLMVTRRHKANLFTTSGSRPTTFQLTPEAMKIMRRTVSLKTSHEGRTVQVSNGSSGGTTARRPRPHPQSIHKNSASRARFIRRPVNGAGVVMRIEWDEARANEWMDALRELNTFASSGKRLVLVTDGSKAELVVKQKAVGSAV